MIRMRSASRNDEMKRCKSCGGFAFTAPLCSECRREASRCLVSPPSPPPPPYVPPSNYCRVECSVRFNVEALIGLPPENVRAIMEGVTAVLLAEGSAQPPTS
jgi:hypothetical protein